MLTYFLQTADVFLQTAEFWTDPGTLAEGDAEPIPPTQPRPRVTLVEGNRSTVVLNSSKPRPTTAIANADDLTSGIRVDVISIKGAEKVLITASIIKDGSVTWTDSKMVDVDVQEAKEN